MILMVDPVTGTGACAALGNSLAEAWNCFIYVAFLNDLLLMGVFFLIAIAVIGFALRLPMAVMSIFGFAVVLGLLYTYNIFIMTIVILVAAIVFTIFILMSIFRSGNLAQR